MDQNQQMLESHLVFAPRTKPHVNDESESSVANTTVVNVKGQLALQEPQTGPTGQVQQSSNISVVPQEPFPAYNEHQACACMQANGVAPAPDGASEPTSSALPAATGHPGEGLSEAVSSMSLTAQSQQKDRKDTYLNVQDPRFRQWWKDVVAYQIWPRSFQDSNGDGIGDIPGIMSRLDYLKDLGIDLIWLSPVYESPMEDFGYDISNYEEIDSRFGTLRDMENLISEVHKRGMKIVMDLVITHTSDQHAWFKESASSKDNDKANWYMWADKRPGHKIKDELIEEPSNWRAAFGGSAWKWVEEREQYYIHLFLPSQPDLNWHEPKMREAVYQSAVKFWLDRGVDGFRLDTANRFDKNLDFPDVPVTVPGKWQPGSKHYMNGPHMHDWLKELRGKMDRDFPGKEIMIVGELPLATQAQVLEYVKTENRELSMVFDFDMVKLGNNDNPDEFFKHQVSSYMDKDPSYTLPLFKKTVKKVQEIVTAHKAWGTVFMENHDQPRSISRYATGEHRYWREASRLLAMLQTTLSGTQFIYQGQEIGMLNMPPSWSEVEFKDPDALTYIDDFLELNKEKPNAHGLAMQGIFNVGRDNSRTPMQWSAKPNAGFTQDNPPWMKINENHNWLNVENQRSNPDSLWHFYKTMIALRKQYKEIFMYGTFDILDHENERTFTFSKMATNDGATAVVILNFSDDVIPLSTSQRHALGHETDWRPLASTVKQWSEFLQPWEGRVYLKRGPLPKDVAEGMTNIGQWQDSKARG